MDTSRIKERIEQGRPEEALSTMLQSTAQLPAWARSWVQLLSGRYQRAADAHQQGLLTEEAFEVRSNRVSSSLLRLVDLLEVPAARRQFVGSLWGTPLVFLILLLLAGTADTRGLKVGKPVWNGPSFSIPIYKLEEPFNDYRISYTVSELDFDFKLGRPHLVITDRKGEAGLTGTLLLNDFERWSETQGFKSIVFKGAGRYTLQVPVEGRFEEAPERLLAGLNIESNEQSPERSHFERIGFAQQLRSGHNMLILKSVFSLSLVICLSSSMLLIFRAGRRS